MSKRKAENTSATSDLFETVVVKKGLKSVCKNSYIFTKIQKDVNEMSSLFAEVSRYIHFCLMKQWRSGNFEPVKFPSLYYPLMRTKKPVYKLDPVYEELRKSLPLYDSSYRSNLFIASANQYEVLFHNNIWMHAYSRLRRFFKFEPDKKKVYRTLSYLFQSHSKEVPAEDLLQEMRNRLHWNGENLHKIQNRKLFWSSLPLFYNLQRYNETNNVKNFSLIPILKHGTHHLQYDSFAFYQMLCALKLYRGALQTDGLAVSFSMKKLKKIAITDDNNNKKKKKKKIHTNEEDFRGDLLKIRSTLYDHKLGLDPGMRLVYGGVRNGVPIKLKSSTYHDMSGFYSRKQKLKNFTASFTEDSQFSPYSEKFEQYTAYQLSIFAEKQALYSQRKVTRLKLQKFICVEKTSHTIVKQLVPDTKKNTLICIGSTEIASNSPMRGYVRTPNRKLVTALKSRRADILFVNEFRTTKLCANCFCENKTSKTPHRYQFCPNCRTCWNRDVNAGVNILYLGECIVQQEEKHTNFFRI